MTAPRCYGSANRAARDGFRPGNGGLRRVDMVAVRLSVRPSWWWQACRRGWIPR